MCHSCDENVGDTLLKARLLSRNTAPRCWFPARKCRLLRVEGFVGSAHPIPTAVNLSFLDGSRYFLSDSSTVILMGLNGRRSRRTTYPKIW
jgi:hypothetical protein